MFTGPVGPVEAFFLLALIHFGNFFLLAWGYKTTVSVEPRYSKPFLENIVNLGVPCHWELTMYKLLNHPASIYCRTSLQPGSGTHFFSPNTNLNTINSPMRLQGYPVLAVFTMSLLNPLLGAKTFA